MRLAIILPTLDEGDRLTSALATALAQGDEVIVSDGGSGDDTVAVARRLGARVVEGPPGRGPQLNRGAAATEAEILLFLHADTVLPPAAGEEVRRAVARGAEAGAFEARFDNPGLLYRFGSWVVNRRTRWTRVPLGDQAQFFTRRTFDALGGYRPWPILEDLDIMRRFRRRGRAVILTPPVVTAARRYERGGIARTLATNWLIWSLYLLGVAPPRLARLYHHIR